jgi:hypothetical protein
MTFEQEIQPVVDYLSQNGFTITEQFTNFVHLESDKTSFVFSKDPREQVISVYDGRKGSLTHILRPEIYNRIFNSGFNPNVSLPENFIAFLKGSGHSLITGDSKVLKSIEEVSHELNVKYTDALLRSQRINELERLWQKKDYLPFIKLMEQTNPEILPGFYDLRYNIAKKRSL